MTHLLSLPFLLRDADKVKGLPEPNKHLLFIGLAVSFQHLCHVFLFLSSGVGVGRFSHCLLSSLGGPNSFAILSFFFLLFNKMGQYICIFNIFLPGHVFLWLFKKLKVLCRSRFYIIYLKLL